MGPVISIRKEKGKQHARIVSVWNLGVMHFDASISLGRLTWCIDSDNYTCIKNAYISIYRVKNVYIFDRVYIVILYILCYHKSLRLKKKKKENFRLLFARVTQHLRVRSFLFFLFLFFFFTWSNNFCDQSIQAAGRCNGCCCWQTW